MASRIGASNTFMWRAGLEQEGGGGIWPLGHIQIPIPGSCSPDSDDADCMLNAKRKKKLFDHLKGSYDAIQMLHTNLCSPVLVSFQSDLDTDIVMNVMWKKTQADNSSIVSYMFPHIYSSDVHINTLALTYLPYPEQQWKFTAFPCAHSQID